MAETSSSYNNKGISYSGKTEREPAGVANTAPMKPLREPSGAAKKSVIRKSAKRAIKRGMISEKAAKKHFGDY